MSIDKKELSKNILIGAADAFVEYRNMSNLAFKPEFLTNDHIKGQKVLSAIERELSSCNEFSISVAFITEGGIVPLLQILKELEKKGIPGRILTTDYLCFSEPAALDRLAGLNNISLKMYRSDQTEGFHTKGYIFERDGLYRIIIGSSNLTQKALTVNKEWNAKIVAADSGEFARNTLGEFESLWNSEHSLEYAIFINEYRQRYETIRRQREVAVRQETLQFDAYSLKPNTMQVAFIQSLKRNIEEGRDRALLISATGDGGIIVPSQAKTA